MGLGGRAKQNEKARETAAESGEASDDPATKAQSRSAWTAGLIRIGAAKVQQQQQAADDKKVRFTIGGVGQRMTKEDFFREVQKLDAGTRKEVVDQSTASSAIKTIAKQDPRRPSQPAIPRIIEQSASSERAPRKRAQSSPMIRKAGESSSSRSPSTRGLHPSEDTGETAVERKRRLAVLAQVDDEDAGETPAERRRREAALGMASEGLAESDSDEEGERVPPARRGIRFAEPTRQGK